MASMKPARTINADLHCHSTASDGTLNPKDVVNRAIEQQVDMLAITDHDNVDGFNEAKEAAGQSIQLISGIEFSAVWQGINIHIVGLNFDPSKLKNAIRHQKMARKLRAEKIANRLEKKGVTNALAGAQKFSTGEILGRPQFAKFLVAEGFFESEKEAFKKWLGAGKIGDVKTSWPQLETIVKWVAEAGGVSVIAHPHHYKLTNRKLGKLLNEFKSLGGNGLEVCASGITPEKTLYYSQLCEKHDLYASRGSDFHTPDNQWVELGRVPNLPENVTPIWSIFS